MNGDKKILGYDEKYSKDVKTKAIIFGRLYMEYQWQVVGHMERPYRPNFG